MSVRVKKALLGFLVLAIGLPGGAECVVLCIRHDGHITVEAACKSSACCPEEQCDQVRDTHDGHDKGAGQNAPHEEHPCTDIPLPFGGEIENAIAVAPARAPVVAVSAAIPAKPSSLFIADWDSHAPPHSVPVLPIPPPETGTTALLI